jgi:hypothetical protein
MKINTFTLIAILLFTINSAKAQNTLSFYNLGDYVAQTQNVSAVYLPKNNFTLGLPGIGFNVNNPFKLNEFLVQNNTTNKLETNFDNLLLNSKALNQSTMQINASLFMLAFKTKKGSISLFANSKLVNNIQYTDQFIKVAANGINDFDLKNNQLNTTGYHEIGLGITQQFLKDKLAIGLRLKYLNGFAHASLKNNASLGLDIDETTQNWNITAANASLRTSGLSNEDTSYFTNNNGFGMDLGATYQVSEKWSVALSVNDIGTINWSENNTSYNIKDTEGTLYSGVDLNTDGSIQNEIESAINTVFKATETVENFSTKLTSNTYFSTKYYASKKNVFTALFANRSVFGASVTNYALGYNRLHKKATYGLLTSINPQDKKVKIGGNAAVNIGAFQMYVATDNFLNAFKNVEEVSQSSLSLGINLTF